MGTPASPLVSAEWLKANFSAPDLKLVEATWFAPFLNPAQTGKEAYDESHISGAVFFDIDTVAEPDTSLSHMLPSASLFAAHMQTLGLRDEDRLIIYDQNSFYASARVWWMFRAMGASHVRVLDGGFQAWRKAGGTVDNLTPTPRASTFTPRPRSGLLKNTAQIGELLQTNTPRQIIDARPAGRFTGTAPEPRKGLPSGHIPGSHNLPSAHCITPDGHMKPASELATLFDAIGVDIAAPAIATCGSGVAAGITALALAMLGNDQVALYDGSWTAWAAEPDAPIATGIST